MGQKNYSSIVTLDFFWRKYTKVGGIVLPNIKVIWTDEGSKACFNWHCRDCFVTDSIAQHSKWIDNVIKKFQGWKPWSSRYGRRLTSKRLCVRIPVLDTGWKIFTFICCKICSVCVEKSKIEEKEALVGPFFKEISENRTYLITLLLKSTLIGCRKQCDHKME